MPVVPQGSREDIIHASIQASQLWDDIQVLHLHKNMRLRSDSDREAFSQWLLNIGHGRDCNTGSPSSTLQIPETMRCKSEQSLITNIYGALIICHTPPSADFFAERAILAPRNDEVRSLNSSILKFLPGQTRIYDSADSYSIEHSSSQPYNNLPVEFLHTLNASGLPVAHLELKIGCPIILLRNIDSNRGLCNGTRATVLEMNNRVLTVRLLSGDHAGEVALIPRITLTPSLSGIDCAITLARRQFPIQLAFALTINKAQGQSLSHVGIDLQNPVFSHGQLYVALSQATIFSAHKSASST